MAGCIGGVQKAMQSLDPTRADNGIDTTALPTAATEARDRHSLSVNLYGCVEDRPVSPFACQSAPTSNQPTLDNQPAADACAKYGTENNVVSFTRAFDRFGKRQTVGIIGRDNPALQSLAKFHAQPATCNAGNICRQSSHRIRIDQTGDGESKWPL